MIERQHRIIFEVVQMEEYETLPRENLKKINPNIVFNSATFPFVDIQYYEEVNATVTILNFLNTLEKEKRIRIIKVLPVKSLPQETKQAEESKKLNFAQKIAKRIFSL